MKLGRNVTHTVIAALRCYGLTAPRLYIPA